MIMKIRKYLFLALVLCSSCTNWLDINPKDIVVEEDLFRSYTGYRNALNGVYKQMGSTDLYGKELSWGFLDVIGQCYISGSYTIGKYHTYYQLADFNYTDVNVKTYIESIWSKSYNSIANCNNIISHVAKEDPAMFPEKEAEKNMIEGEALALRAFLHFDLLRLFAPAPAVDDHRPYIPYFENFPSYGESNLTVKEVVEKVILDLTRAKELVHPFDSLDEDHWNRLNSSNRFVSNGNAAEGLTDVFYAYRGYRMNYPAIVALLARVYNYAGELKLANDCAKEVIGLADTWAGKLYSFTTKEKVGSDKKMSSDLIFTLSSPKLYDNYLPYTNSSAGGGDACLVLKNVSTMFDDVADYRQTDLLTAIRSNQASNRNIRASTDQVGKMIEDMLPVIRLSELYYMIAEYQASLQDWGKAVEALDAVREGRYCTKGRLDSKVTDAATFRDELLKEVRREFVTEGQIFFYYKKFNVRLTDKMAPEAFVLPLPDSESIN